MTRIKELRLHGFKTFADATRFVFGPGVNAVIGPNGSGKSNMADAVRWVLGEQSNRSLRTRRGDDVIFAGSDQRRAQGMAEAVLTLDNADGWLPIDYAEVSVARRAYRTGEGEYLINGSRARLRDVVELLGGGRLGANELVVVGQGTVDAALSLRPDERRQLFEEAAGVKNLQVRKNEALSRLDAARDNLARVNDLVVELRPQVRRLALQAAHQQEHAELAERAGWLADEGYRRAERGARDAAGAARRSAAAAEADLEAARVASAASRAALEAAESRHRQAESDLQPAANAREVAREARIRAEAHLESLASRRAALESEVEEAERERKAVAAALDNLAGAREEHDPLVALEALAADADRRLAAASRVLAERDAALLAAEEAMTDARRRRSEWASEAARHAEQAARLEARRERLGDELALARRELERTEAQLVAAAATMAEAQRGADGARAERAASAAHLSDARAAAESTRLAAAALAERIGSLRAELEALHDRGDRAGGLGRLLVAAGWHPMLDQFAVPAHGWPAAEAVIGGDLEEALLWGTGELTERLTGALGSTRLLVVEADQPDLPDAAIRDQALAAVGADQTLAEWLGLPRAPLAFHRAALAPGLDALLHGWRGLPPGWCGVTPQGDLADGRGVISVHGRGDEPSPQSAQRQARRRDLNELLLALEAQLEAATGAAARAHAAAVEAQQFAETAVDAEAKAQQGEAMSRATRGAAAEQQRRLGERIGQIEAEIDRLPASPAPQRATDEVEPDLSTLEAELTVSLARRAEATAERDAARLAWVQARDALDDAERTRPRSGDRPLRLAQLESIDRTLAGRRAAIGALEGEAAAARTALEPIAAADLAASARRQAAELERDQARADLLAAERSALEHAARVAEFERRAAGLAAEVGRLQESLAALARERQAALETETGDPVSAAGRGPLPADIASLDDPGLEQELRRVRRSLAQVGSVNPFATDEHRELSARLDGLTGQEGDLQRAISSITDLIHTLETDIASRFDAAFSAIGAKFDEYCRLLFDGGSASLSIGEGSEAEASGGIEISVRPPGKRLHRLSMLSGGERALTGVALLFAMLDVNPVPFCILDEVDAALDEANIGRFATALRQLSQKIDFVVITHNRATIEIADTIYGVTMTESAVSRVVSLRLADLPAEVLAG